MQTGQRFTEIQYQKEPLNPDAFTTQSNEDLEELIRCSSSVQDAIQTLVADLNSVNEEPFDSE